MAQLHVSPARGLLTKRGHASSSAPAPGHERPALPMGTRSNPARRAYRCAAVEGSVQEVSHPTIHVTGLP